ncbi:MAG: hypothetical protein R3Y53_11405 [Bacillota bacterium]
MIATQEELRANENSFLSYGVVLTTYDFAVENEKEMQSVGWDLMIFEEATALCSVYQEDNVKAKVLKKISVSSYIIFLILYDLLSVYCNRENKKELPS